MLLKTFRNVLLSVHDDWAQVFVGVQDNDVIIVSERLEQLQLWVQQVWLEASQVTLRQRF